MTDHQPPAPGWWLAVDGQWYPPDRHPEFSPPVAASAPAVAAADEPEVDFAEAPRSRFAPPPDEQVPAQAPPAPYSPPTAHSPAAPYSPPTAYSPPTPDSPTGHPAPASPPSSFAAPAGSPTFPPAVAPIEGAPHAGPQFTAPQFPPPLGPPAAPASFGAPGYGPPPAGPPPYGQPAFGQPPYGQPPYGQPPYGQPAFGQPPYGQPSFGQPPEVGAITARPVRSRRTGLILGAVAVVAVLVVGVVAVLLVRDDGPLGGGLPTVDEDLAALRAALPDENDVPAGTVRSTANAAGFDPTGGLTGADSGCSGQTPPRPRAVAQAAFAHDSELEMYGVVAMSFEDEEAATRFYDTSIANLDCALDDLDSLPDDMPEELAQAFEFDHEPADVDGADAAESVDADMMVFRMSMLIARDGRHVALAFSTEPDRVETLLSDTLAGL